MQQIFKYGTLPLAGQVGQFYVVEMIEVEQKVNLGKIAVILMRPLKVEKWQKYRYGYE